MLRMRARVQPSLGSLGLLPVEYSMTSAGGTDKERLESLGTERGQQGCRFQATLRQQGPPARSR